MTRRIPGSKAMGIRIERLMQERNLRAAHVAEELGVRRDLVGRWLKGGGITEDHLMAVAALFDSTAAWIAAGTGPMHPELSAPHEDAETVSIEAAKANRRGKGSDKARRTRS